jgi:hypothetical protein
MYGAHACSEGREYYAGVYASHGYLGNGIKCATVLTGSLTIDTLDGKKKVCEGESISESEF